MTPFEYFWSQWPRHHRKVARKQCEAKWRTMGCDKIADTIMDSLARWKRCPVWLEDDGRFIPAPLVWLNQQRWEADVPARRDWQNPRDWNADRVGRQLIVAAVLTGAARPAQPLADVEVIET